MTDYEPWGQGAKGPKGQRGQRAKGAQRAKGPRGPRDRAGKILAGKIKGKNKGKGKGRVGSSQVRLGSTQKMPARASGVQTRIWSPLWRICRFGGVGGHSIRFWVP